MVLNIVQKPRLWKYKSGSRAGQLRPQAKLYLSYKLKLYYKQKASNIVYRKKYKSVTQVVSKKPIANQIGQVNIKVLAKKGSQSIMVKGYSYLNNASDTKVLKKMTDQAFKSAYARIPFSPDTMKIIDVKFVYYSESSHCRP